MIARGAGPDQMVRFQMVWPAWLEEQVKDAARARALSVAAWLREAAIDKLSQEDR